MGGCSVGILKKYWGMYLLPYEGNSWLSKEENEKGEIRNEKLEPRPNLVAPQNSVESRGSLPEAPRYLAVLPLISHF